MKRFWKITALVLVLCICAYLAPRKTLQKVSADPTADELRDQIMDLQNQLTQLEEWKKQAEDEKTAAAREVQGFDAQIVVLQEQIEVSMSLLDEIKAELDVLNKQLAQKQSELEDYKKLYAQRVRANYEVGQVSYLEVLLSAGSFSDYLTRIQLVEQIMEFDNKLIKDMKNVVKQINEQIALVDAKRAEQQAVQDQLDAQMSDLENKRAEMQAVVEAMTEAELAYQSEMEAAEAALDESLKELDEIIARSAAEGGPGILSWPAPGHTLITDYWGWRPDPFGGDGTTWHNGVDIGCRADTPVYAMAGGTVISAYYDSAVGNLIIIDHGGGISTRYYHLQSIEVDVGQVVERGEFIAYSGNTGYYTTGAHLHFEVRVYNPDLGYSESVDPFDYTSPY